MESAGKIMFVLASSSLWLTVSGLLLWLYLRSRRQLSPGTRAAASILVVLPGWIWIGIPLELDSTWIQPKLAAISSQAATRIDHLEALASLPFISQPQSGQSPLSDTGAPAAAEAPRAARLMPDVSRLAGTAACAIWLTGIAILLSRSIRGFLALSRMVQALPRASVEWQNELSALCRRQKIAAPPVLKIGNVAAPLLVQTLNGICIVAPRWLWQSCTPDQRTSILLHELAHYRRGDLWRQLAMRLLVLPHWFNPVAWWAARQFEAASEAACDEAACGGDSLQAISYSKALLVLSEKLLRERSSIRYAQALAISGGSLTERIRFILHPEFQKESHMSRFLILSAMTVLAGLATIRIQAANQSFNSKNESDAKESNPKQSNTVPGATLRRRTITEEYEKAEPAKAAADSLLANGGFEESQSNSSDPEAWFGTRLPKTAGHFLMSASKSVAHGGQRSVVVEIGDNHPDLPVAYNWTADAKGWQAGETYELSGWIKTEDAKKPAFIMAQFWSGEGTNKKMIGGATTELASPIKGTTDWTRVSTRLKVPQGTGIVRIRAGLPSQDNRGAKAWLDDISLVKIASK